MNRTDSQAGSDWELVLSHTLRKIETGNFNEDKQQGLTAEDIRFTIKGNTLYSFVMGRPNEAVVNALGLYSPQAPGKIQRVRILGYGGDVTWTQEDSALRVTVPPACTSDIGLTLKVDLA
jgi:alpha-L-fucosidase